ncbi:hypothetical protein NDU88_001113 [Pleurodeles waltl]|uniref:Uncharacterized protein n=1 Tax=Pleurodeles waltl TaxID=8319 RepID=A0AAV7U773_PLEWA|nr:hypothetical protein NDU88_001113 [Pleurodeles waltl]
MCDVKERSLHFVMLLATNEAHNRNCEEKTLNQGDVDTLWPIALLPARGKVQGILVAKERSECLENYKLPPHLSVGLSLRPRLKAD